MLLQVHKTTVHENGDLKELTNFPRWGIPASANRFMR